MRSEEMAQRMRLAYEAADLVTISVPGCRSAENPLEGASPMMRHRGDLSLT
jgi:hypothetical protein